MFALGMHVRREKKRREDTKRKMRRSVTLPPTRPSTALQYPNSLLQLVAEKTVKDLPVKSSAAQRQMSEDNLNSVKNQSDRKISEGSKNSRKISIDSKRSVVASTTSASDNKCSTSRDIDSIKKKTSKDKDISPSDVILIEKPSNSNDSSAKVGHQPFLARLTKRCSQFRLIRRKSFG